jgi:hypothetical protein
VSDQIRVNGNQLSWGSITVKIDNEPYYGFTKINYADGRERVKSYGMGRHHAPRGRSRGKYTVEPVALAGPKSTVQALRDALAAKSSSGNAYGDVAFAVTVNYVEADDTPITVELEDCVFTKNSESHDEGADPLLDEIELDCMRIRRNGKVLFDDTAAS